MIAEAREQAVTRAVATVAGRSEARYERFVDSARSLAESSGRADFTVQQVVSEAGLSLKSFYALFRGKDDLLCALLEEDTRAGAQILRATIDEHVNPRDRIETFVRGIVALAVGPGARGYAAVLVREHRRLEIERPEALRAAMRPLAELLEHEIERSDAQYDRPDAPRCASMVMAVMIDELADLVVAPDALAKTGDVADAVWTFCRGGLALTPEPGADE